jgi:hypothetical protein
VLFNAENDVVFLNYRNWLWIQRRTSLDSR